MTSRRSARVIVIAVVAVVALIGGLGAWWAIAEYQATHGPECTVPRPIAKDAPGVSGAKDSAPLGLDAVQLQHASTINAVGLQRGEPERARVIAVATAWQESSLRNVDSGDRDSLGLFQQRPSQGWGTPAELMDPVYATTQFYDHLAKVAGWQDMPLAQAAQKVQRSAFPGAYAKWEWDAATLVLGLSGGAPPALSCRRGATASTAAPPHRDPLPGTSGAGPQITDLLSAAHAELTGLTIASIPAGGTSASVTAALPATAEEVSGRALAAWFVAHSASFNVTEVTVADQTWSGHKWHEAGPALDPGRVQVSVGG